MAIPQDRRIVLEDVTGRFFLPVSHSEKSVGASNTRVE